MSQSKLSMYLQVMNRRRCWASLSSPGCRDSTIFAPNSGMTPPRNWKLGSMHDHNRTMRILEHALGVRAQHPAMKNGVAALAHHNEAGLDGICPVDDLLRRMANDNLSFKFNLLLAGAL